MNSLFISHGGGPLPLLGDARHAQMVHCLKEMATKLPKPDALIVVSAHWEEEVPTITSGAKPALIYDYFGFPPESYEIQYPCPGAPALARRMNELFAAAGISAKLDEQRGLDHGVFVPLNIMYPQADMPCVQLSLLKSLDPLAHIQMGRALRALSNDHVLVIGSGFSFHNLKAFFSASTPEATHNNQAFEAWLLETCASQTLTEAQRVQRLLAWKEAPGAAFCHPREEHLLPLHVCYGLAERACTMAIELDIMDKRSSMYGW